MRDILFRGKRLDDGGWSVGDLLQYRGGETIIHSYVNGCRVADAIDPATVGQYIGLKDKNGKRIFEGDILVLRPGRPHIVSFEHGTFALTNTAIPIGYADKFEIVGNAYDNLELKGGGEG